MRSTCRGLGLTLLTLAVAGCGTVASPTGPSSAGSPSGATTPTPSAAPAGPDWHLVPAGASPLPRHSAGVAYDAAHHAVLLSGGRTGCGASQVDYTDTWAWSGSTWAQQHPADHGPAGLPHFTITDDQATSQVIAVGIYTGCGVGTAMFSWDGHEWTAAPQSLTLPPPMFNGVTAFDQATGQFLVVGSPYSAAPGAPEPASIPEQTWNWDGHAWTQLTPAHSLPPLVDPAIAYDADSRRVVLFGGQPAANSLANDMTAASPVDATWTWDGTTWTQASPAARPPARAGASMAYDAATQQLVLFGGEAAGVYFDDTWAWDGTTWRRVPTAHHPSARTRSAMAYDDQTGELVLFGGALTPAADTNDTWIYRGQ